jgi:hypothetical protein
VDVAIERWQAFTGQQALHEDDGKSFAEVQQERQQEPPSRAKEEAT